MLGLKRETVVLMQHQDKWRERAVEVISKLKTILGDTAIDIQHVGSTSINGIHAKPIIDIAVAVKLLDDVAAYIDTLQRSGIAYCKWAQKVTYMQY